MEAKAELNSFRESPRKMRLVADLIRGKDINEAITLLQFSTKKAAPVISKLLKSAVENAKQTGKVDVDTLFVKAIQVGEGPTLPARFRPRAQGRATPILKRTSHISVTLQER